METTKQQIDTQNLRDLIESKELRELRTLLEELPAPDIAELIVGFSEYDMALVFRILPKEQATSIFEYLSFDEQERLIDGLSDNRLKVIVNEMSADDRTALLEELPSQAVAKIIQLLDPDQKKIAIELLGYPEDSVGRLMTPEFIAINETWTIQQALNYIREHGRDSETLNIIYVIDEHGKLINDIRIREFLLHDPKTIVSEIRDSGYVALKVTEEQSSAIELFKKYGRSALPVIDSDEVLVGIITFDDVFDLVEREDTEDVQKLGGMEALDDPYLDTPFSSMIKKRAVWLVVLFFSELLTASAMGFFEDEIAKAVILTLFIPLIISSGGNSGSQATTLIIRAMAVGEITLKDWFKVLRKELLTGFTLGAIVGGAGFLRVAVWYLIFGVYEGYWLALSMTISLALIGVVLWGTITGAMLPFILRKIGLDPATASAPFVATLVDVTGLVIYFMLSITLLKGSLL